MTVNINDLKALREKTSAGVADCREALEQASGDMKTAEEILKKKGLERAAKKSDREVKAGAVFSYIHHTGRLGAILSLACETDFVAKTDDFQKLGKEIALHIASTKPASVEELLEQEYVRDGSKKISELIKETIGKLGENISVVDFRVLEV
ncbi:MAG: translation elongation factor Ts [Patescibacteria group bacterium]